MTDELLGKGGFGAVYLADFNGRNAAAKVVGIEQEFASPAGLGDHGDASEAGEHEVKPPGPTPIDVLETCSAMVIRLLLRLR